MNIYDIKDKKVILRVDFNIPIENGIIINDDKIIRTIPTINLLLKNNNKIIIITHLGRPEGKFDKNLILDPIIKRLEELLNKKVIKIDLNNKNLDNGNIFIFENIRFFKEEEENNKKFAKEISKFGDVYINDAFGTSHREHASIVGIQDFLPSFKGLLIKEELKNLEKIKNPKKPFAIILGGKKYDKLKIINKLLDKIDIILIGSYFSMYFLEDKDEIIKDIKKKCEIKNIKLIIPNENEVYDINKETISRYKEVLNNAKTIFWNGPLGKYEEEEFSKGTVEILKYLLELNTTNIILGGGDLGAIYSKIGINNNKIYISTGGGATLKYLEEGSLIGIKNLR